ncbi:hypothetical protein QWY15_13220 [Planococcus sp. N064]|uniref:Uncharacterized protein n=1 Tax=Planococcus liqunii TaxID=3058394 RepID=A0ABT8MTL8_9BACL|nr:hypothetical protein [Planococcus sp. N064]
MKEETGLNQQELLVVKKGGIFMISSIGVPGYIITAIAIIGLVFLFQKLFRR